jgi:hypothetical protein
MSINDLVTHYVTFRRTLGVKEVGHALKTGNRG